MTEPSQHKPRGPGRPKGSSGEKTRARILEAARGCFGARGFGATTNKQIGAAAGVSAAAIYRYYPSKLALFLGTVQGAMDELEQALRTAVEGCEPGRAELVALMEAAGSLHEAQPSLAAFLSCLPVEMRRHPEIADAMAAEPDAISQMMAEAVTRAHEGGQLAEGVDPDEVLSMVLACNIGLSLWGAAIMPEGAGGAMRAYARLLEGGLFAGDS